MEKKIYASMLLMFNGESVNLSKQVQITGKPLTLSRGNLIITRMRSLAKIKSLQTLNPKCVHKKILPMRRVASQLRSYKTMRRWQ